MSACGKMCLCRHVGRCVFVGMSLCPKTAPRLAQNGPKVAPTWLEMAERPPTSTTRTNHDPPTTFHDPRDTQGSAATFLT